GHRFPVRQVAFAPNGQAVSFSPDVAFLWDVDTGQPIRTLGPLRFITGLAFCPDGRRLLLATADNKLQFWDVVDNREVRSFGKLPTPVHCLALSADGKYALSGSGRSVRRDNQLVHEDCTVRLWDLGAGRELRRFEGHTGPIRSVAFAPDGERLLSAAGQALRLGEFPAGPPASPSMPPEPTPTPAGPITISAERRRFQADGKAITSLDISPKGDRLLAVHNGEMTLWKTDTGKLVQHIPKLRGKHVMEAKFLPEGRRAIARCSDHTLVLWNLDAAKPIHIFQGHTAAIQCLALSADGRRLYSGAGAPLVIDGELARADGQTVYEDCTIRVWDTETGKPLRRFEGYTQPVFNIALLPDGGALARTGTKLVMWDVNPGRGIATVGPSLIVRVAACPDGKRMIVVTPQRELQLWDIKNNKMVRELGSQPTPIASLVVSRNGRYALAGTAGAETASL